jgi:replicative DNA helicase
MLQLDERRSGPAERHQPHSVEAERAALGGVLLSPSKVTDLLASLQTDDFFIPAHREIYDAMAALHGRDKPVDVLLVADELKARDMLSRLEGGESYLLALANSVPTAENLGHYIRIVGERSALRKLIAACAEIQSSAYGDFGDMKEFLAEASAKITDVALKRSGPQAFRAFGDEIDSALADMEARSKLGGRITGARTGVWKLDKVLKGLQAQNTYVIAARPGKGKSALAVNVAVRHALANVEKNRSLFFSLEMPRKQLVDRILAQETPLDHEHIRMATLGPRDWTSVTGAAARLHRMPVVIDDESFTPAEIEAQTNRYRALNPEAEVVVFVDYVQLARFNIGKGQSLGQAISDFAAMLKRLAKRLKVAIVEVCQLNRDSEKEGRRPRISDLGESGGIERHADSIIFIHDEGQRIEDGGPIVNTEDGPVELIVAKNRAGRTGIVKSRWMGRYCGFFDLERPVDHDGGGPLYLPPASASDAQERMDW